MSGHHRATESKLSYALKYAAIGWHVFPAHWITQAGECSCGKDCGGNAGKHPFGRLAINGQASATIDTEVITRWWGNYPDCNIGVFLEPSGLVAVDIDPRNGGHETIETLEDKHGIIFSDVMQFTGGGGEHRVFTLPNSNLSLPGQLGAGVDLKANGYIIVEPSNHKSGGKYEWEGSSAPYEGNAPSPLPDFIRDLAVTRQSTELSSNGFVSQFVTGQQIDDLRAALLFIDADDRNTWIRVGNALKTIGAAGWNLFLEYSQRSAKFNLADQRRVWVSFRPKSISYETIFHMAQSAGWINKHPGLGDIVPTLISPEFFLKNKPAESASKAQKLPGILGVIEDYYNATSPIPQPKFAQQAALGIVSTLLARRFKTVFDDYSSLYFCNIAPTACGKEHIKTVSEIILKAVGSINLMAGDGYTSAGAVISTLTDKPVHLSVIDELGLYLEACNSKTNHIGKSANTALMEVIGRVKGEIRSKNYSVQGKAKKSTPIAESILHPAITIQAMTTPSTFYANLSIDMIKDGFFGRFITVHSKMPRVVPKKVRPIAVPDEIIAWADAINARINDPANCFHGNPATIGEQCIIDVAADAEQRLTEFSTEMVELMNNLEKEHLEGLAGRMGEFCWRLALIIAIAIDPFATIVSIISANIAVDYLRLIVYDVVADVRDNLSGSDYQKAKIEILAAIRLTTDGVTQRDLHRKAPYSKYKDKELTEIMQSLITADLIGLVNTREGKAGKARMAFIALDNTELA